MALTSERVTENQLKGIPTDSLSGGGGLVSSVADLYDKRYAQAEDGLFTQQDGTPMLNAFNRRLNGMRGTLRVVEVGAGSGVQALVIARNVSGVDVIAVDTSARAIARIRERLSGQEAGFADGLRITLIQADIFDWLRQQKPGSIHGIHANSFGHFLQEDIEETFLRLARVTQPLGGLMAISQKSIRDGLLVQPLLGSATQEQDWIRATPRIDRIERRFLRSPEALAHRLIRAGYSRVLDQDNWTVPNYDAQGITADFFGVLAEA